MPNPSSEKTKFSKLIQSLEQRDPAAALLAKKAPKKPLPPKPPDAEIKLKPISDTAPEPQPEKQSVIDTKKEPLKTPPIAPTVKAITPAKPPKYIEKAPSAPQIKVKTPAEKETKETKKPDTEEKKSGGLFGILVFLLILVLLIAGLLYWFFVIKPQTDTGDELPDEQEVSEVNQANEEGIPKIAGTGKIVALNDFVADYFSTTFLADRLIMMRGYPENPTIEQNAKEFYSERALISGVLTNFTGNVIRILYNNKTFYKISFVLDYDNNYEAIIEETENGFKLDWPSLTGYGGDMTFTDFINQRPKEAKKILITAKRGHYYDNNHPPERYLCLQTTNIDNMRYAYAFVDKNNSGLYNRITDQINRAEKNSQQMVKLTVSAVFYSEQDENTGHITYDIVETTPYTYGWLDYSK